MIDIEKVHKLLSIAKLSAEFGTPLRGLHEAAIRELGEHHRVAVKENAEARKKAEAEALKKQIEEAGGQVELK